jgi:CheY-like chemotaxis protein
VIPAAPPGARLAGKRVLLVEDEFLIAAVAEQTLLELGAQVVGPAYRLGEALALAQAEPLDGAVLDINLNGERSDPVAAVLMGRAIPFVFATGYGPSRTPGFDVPVLDKPYSPASLERALHSAMRG